MQKLAKLWNKIFPPDDWIILWNDKANWNIVSDFGDYTERCFYYIKYSPYRKKIILECSGYKPKEHQYYNVALSKLGEVQRAHYKTKTEEKS